LKHTEAQLQQTQKMESIGKLAGGIAHDFNNLLTAINGFTDLSISLLERNHPVAAYLDEVKKSGERAATLTSQLLAYSRKQVLEAKVVDINSLVSDLRNMLSRIIGEHLNLVLRLFHDLGKVRADPNQIEQVILNLIVNARDATPNGGDITLETENVVMDEEAIGTHPEILPGHYVRLSVSDSGCGMEPHVLSRIFEPFYTTKEFGKGSGMGLSMVQGIVTQTGGYIYAYSEPGLGSVFKIYLPTEKSKDPVVKPEAIEAVGDYRGKETILLAEDEESVRKLIRGILELQGYTVLEGRDGVEAERVGMAYGGAIHLLLTDVIMPRRNGRDLADLMKVTRPGLKVIFMSGYTDDAIVRHGLLAIVCTFIQKPFSPKNLVRTVRAILDSDSNPALDLPREIGGIIEA
ncbi:MAG: ATP-binding protein, partial [Fibrobacterota bacterium]|nr:ATP-binding protein [Fibrobacterota bacterium]